MTKGEAVTALRDIIKAMNLLVSGLMDEQPTEEFGTPVQAPVRQDPVPEQEEYPRKIACKWCKKPVYLQKSRSTGSLYTTETPTRNDFHDCEMRPPR